MANEQKMDEDRVYASTGQTVAKKRSMRGQTKLLGHLDTLSFMNPELVHIANGVVYFPLEMSTADAEKFNIPQRPVEGKK